MKISALYFLQYPNCSPVDPYLASSEVRVEVGENEPSVESFDHTYAFTVYTLGFLEKELKERQKEYVLDKAVIIVPKFDVDLIERAIKSVLVDMDRYGVRID